MNLVDTIQENVAVAVTTLRTSKLRSALTILGVVIGISTVMAMATIVNGIQQQIVRTIEIAGPTTFYVMKVFSQTPLNPDALPKWVRVRPDLREQEAQIRRPLGKRDQLLIELGRDMHGLDAGYRCGILDAFHAPQHPGHRNRQHQHAARGRFQSPCVQRLPTGMRQEDGLERCACRRTVVS